MAVGDALSSLARSPSSAAVLHGWMARPLLPACSGALDGLSAPPSSAFRATNYHTFGSDSVVRVRPLWGHAQNARSAKTYSIYRSNYKGSLAFYCALCCVSRTKRPFVPWFQRVPFSHLLPEYHQRTTKLTFNGACHVLQDPPTALIHMNG